MIGKHLEYPRGLFIGAVVMCFFTIAYMVFETLGHLKELRMRYVVPYYNETGKLVCMCLICSEEMLLYVSVRNWDNV